MLLYNQHCSKHTQGLKRYRDLQVHDHTLVHLLPQVSPEDLDEGDLEGGDLAMHEDASQIQLHLEAHVHIGTVDGGGPPQRETPVGDLVQTRPLCIGQLLVPAQEQVKPGTLKIMHMCTAYAKL